eukprot:15349412-Ditylum_brightwellii.AAC.1
MLHLPDISGCWLSLLCARRSRSGPKKGERSSSNRDAAFRAERAKMKQKAEDRDQMIEEGEYDDALDSGYTSDVYDEGDDLDVRVDFSEDIDDKKKL